MTDAANIIVVLTGVIAVIISLITAASSAKQSAFERLEKVVARLERRLKDEEDRGDYLEKQLRKYQRAFARAVLFIRTNLPSHELPDFMIDTGDVTDKDKR
jgi:hypothetical protein